MPETDINAHLDNGCESTNDSKPSISKLAPIFGKQLGKRGTDTRPSTSQASKRSGSSQVIEIDDDEPSNQSSRKRPKVEGEFTDKSL